MIYLVNWSRVFRAKNILRTRMKRVGIDVSVGVGQFVLDKLTECGYANADTIVKVFPSSKGSNRGRCSASDFVDDSMDEDPYTFYIYKEGEEEDRIAGIHRFIFVKGKPNKTNWEMTYVDLIEGKWSRDRFSSLYNLFGKEVLGV